VVDAQAVAEAALTLWSERGFAATGWNDIADATGVSARTLMRHFPDRAAIAWVGLEEASERLRESLAASSPGAPPAHAVREAVVRSVSHDDFVRRLGSRWAHLVSTEPQLAASAAPAYRSWEGIIAAYLANRLPAMPEPARRAVATAYQAAAHTALVEWAADDGAADPADAVDAALRWLDIVVPEAPRR
jgi:AcrR family transcriptional regulator